MTWEPSLTNQQPFRVTHVGLLKSEVRVYLRPVGAASPCLVLRMREVAMFFDSLPRGAKVQVTSEFPAGSFGFRLRANDPHHSVKISAVEPASGFFLGLARTVEYGSADPDEAANWPV